MKTKVVTLSVLLFLAGPLVESAAAQVFGPPQDVHIQSGGALSVYAVDLDSDDDLDVLATQSGVHWYENQGGGVFGAQQVISANGASSVYAADLDGDGDADVLSASGSIAWYENQGGGVFGAQQVISTSGASSFYAADLDGDCDIDVLSKSGANKIVWYENNGGGLFGDPQEIATTITTVDCIYAADLDSDGDLDVLSGTGSGPFGALDSRVAWYENQGEGAFGSEQVLFATHVGITSVYAADLDGDGDQDVLFTVFMGENPKIPPGKVAWCENQGQGVFGGHQVIGGGFGMVGVYAKDLDGDCDVDVISVRLAESHGEGVEWYENKGGYFGSGQVVWDPEVGHPQSVVAADLDGDGDSEILACNSGAGSIGKIVWCDNLTDSGYCDGVGSSDPSDCNGNGILDVDEIASEPSIDCNGNGIPDDCDIASGTGKDQDGNGILDECLSPPLASNPVQISVATGGQHSLTLTAPQEYGGSLYLVLGSSSGTVPGWTLDGVFVPLQIFDPYFLFIASSPNVPPFINTLGSLSPDGTASAAIAVPSCQSELAGVTLHHAYVLFGSSLEVVYASNPVPLELVP